MKRNVLLTVEDVMNLDIMQHAVVRSGSGGLNSRLVKWVSVIEVPVEDFVGQHELVLSTAIGCGHDQALFLQFVKDIYNSGAAALAISTGRYIYDIPENAVAFAESHHFPIIEVPWKVRFSAIIEAVLNEMNSRRHKVFKRSEDVQQRLFSLILQGAHLSKIAEVVHQELGHPLLIVDHRGNVYGESRHIGAFRKTWQRFIQSEPKIPKGVPVRTPQHLSHSDIRCLRVARESAIQVVIRSSGKIVGYMIIPLPSDVTAENFLQPNDSIVLDYTSMATALWFSREHAVQEAEMRLRDDFVWNLAKGETPSWEAVLSRAKALGYKVTLPYVCTVGLIENLRQLYERHPSDDVSYEHWRHNIMRYTEEQIHHIGNTVNLETMTTCQDGLFVIFLECPQQNFIDEVNYFLDLIENEVKSLLPGAVMSWGIGDSRAGVRSFHHSYSEARVTLDIGRRQRGPGTRSTHEDTSVYRALMCLKDNKDLKEIVTSTIGKLVDYDRQKPGMDLIDTLNAYVRHHGNVSRTARALNLHRQSLLYRLRKIESLTNRSLVNADDLFLLNLSIKLWTLTADEQRVQNA